MLISTSFLFFFCDVSWGVFREWLCQTNLLSFQTKQYVSLMKALCYVKTISRVRTLSLTENENWSLDFFQGKREIVFVFFRLDRKQTIRYFFWLVGEKNVFLPWQGALLYSRHLILKSGASVSKRFLSGYTACEMGTGIQSQRHAAVIS